ncbi:uncharacterized protein [Musca autumnalis]|uniref:uncharacterized protein n=1 Tax=Musca autumnalis TaxID=221902 RepID=UPI003CEA9551
MGGTHKKKLRAEKAKVKLKGAKLPKGLNITKTGFKVRKITIREQLKESQQHNRQQQQQHNRQQQHQHNRQQQPPATTPAQPPATPPEHPTTTAPDPINGTNAINHTNHLHFSVMVIGSRLRPP